MSDDAIPGTAVEIGSHVEPAHTSPASITLFRTDDPVEVVEQATRVADALKRLIIDKGLASRISGREHVRVEGWQTLGSMLGVVPVVVWTRELPGANGWEARVEARTLDGRVVGAAEAMCSKDERTWKSRDPYALRSMAQTRATSKALRGPLGFVVTLAGYDATPAEEIPTDSAPLRDAEPIDGLVSASGIRRIYEAATDRLSGVELLTVLLQAQQLPLEDVTEQEALARINTVVKTLPAASVPDVIAEINR